MSPHPDERFMYADYLLDKGYCVLETPTRAEASRLTTDVWLSAVITDVRLAGGRDGLHLTIQRGSKSTAAGLPVLILPGTAAAGTLEEAERSGCDLVLLKPCPPNVLADVTGRLVTARKPKSSSLERVE